MILSRRSLSWAFVLGIVAALPAAAQRPMGIVDLVNVPRLADPQISPDGKAVVYTLSQPDWKASRQISHIWRVLVAGGAPTQLTTGPDGESAPRWSPDGQSIAFVAK